MTTCVKEVDVLQKFLQENQMTAEFFWYCPRIRSEFLGQSLVANPSDDSISSRITIRILVGNAAVIKPSDRSDVFSSYILSRIPVEKFPIVVEERAVST